MADLTTNFIGITSPNPFWLASAPPTDKEYNVRRAFDAGWGADRRLLGLNNIELITDRPLQTNLDEMTRVKRDYPDRALIASLMVPVDENSWKNILARVIDTGCDGVELNFGCPHGMSERGMGSAVGQVPEYVQQVTEWCKTHSNLPVIVKLTPNITAVDLDSFAPEPTIDGKGAHGGYCGPAVKPIALNMVADIARTPSLRGLPISGIGGVTTWRDSAEFMALGAGNVQVCTAAMTYGFKIVQEMISGLSQYMDEKGFAATSDLVGRAVPNVVDWQHLNLNYVTKARIDQDLCIRCGRCFAACEDTSHQAISMSQDRVFEVIDAECVACNLCVNVCPVKGCITMEELQPGVMDERTGRVVPKDYANWTSHPNNPGRCAAE